MIPPLEEREGSGRILRSFPTPVSTGSGSKGLSQSPARPVIPPLRGVLDMQRQRLSCRPPVQPAGSVTIGAVWPLPVSVSDISTWANRNICLEAVSWRSIQNQRPW